jgi:hypothetical protein
MQLTDEFSEVVSTLILSCISEAPSPYKNIGNNSPDFCVWQKVEERL